jgi:4-alpha-glucanotransferase
MRPYVGAVIRDEYRNVANEKNISIMGDVPIFVAYDSADVWTHPEIFHLDSHGKPTVVAGVPPDYFSKTGQLWGNPLYNWEAIKKNDFEWWVSRFKEVLRLVDMIRIDHFRGFEAYWEVAAGEKTAVNGKWTKAPGEELFKTLQKRHGKLPIIAEDLGVITPEVEKIRDDFGFPGMKILQFAFDGNAKNQYLPHNFTSNSVVYSGTHDNETTFGWFKNITSKEKKIVRDYLGTNAKKINYDFIRLAIASVSDIAVVPVQDIIGCGDEGRMNTPGSASGNWSYRFKMSELRSADAKLIAKLCKIYGR